MDFRESQQYLASIRQESSKLKFADIRRMIELFPFDLSRIRFIQVAGTNGKGSTSHFLASILKEAGFRVGLFTSPHLQDVRERISIDGRNISRKDFALEVGRIRAIGKRLLDQRLIQNMPTFFEHLFLAALVHFHRHRVDWVVLEAGLGGRLDATTTITPDISVITNISKDHTDVLGGTIARIAREKAGIIKYGVPLVCGCPRRSTASRVIRRTALRKKADFHEVFHPRNQLEVSVAKPGYGCRFRTPDREYRFRVALNGMHQAGNAAIAVLTVDVLRRLGWEISERDVSAGIRSMFIPARIESFVPSGRRLDVPPLILDGGHNVEGIRALIGFMEERKLRGVTLIYGVLKDKPYRRMAALLKPYARNVIAMQPASQRALPADRLTALFDGKRVRVARKASEALNIAKRLKRAIIVTGSLYLAGEMRTAIQRRHGTWISGNSRTSKIATGS